MTELIDAIKNTIEAGINHDWVTLGTSIADIVANGISVISGFFG
ncbi:beta-class phenol-soluble modulin [Staphylococcus delphini]|nr:beta-class phenol-soluble modulin [Staphylococcus delphini]MTV22844.1 beta-class phenol-soluble modulin [Staphylococcus delphini]